MAFSGTVKENIQMGFVQYSDEHLLNVAKISGVDEFVRHNPAGYDFMLKSGGKVYQVDKNNPLI